MKFFRTIVWLTLAGLVALPVSAQRLDPAQWKFSIDQQSAPPGSTVLGRLTATVPDGWHLYSQTTPNELNRTELGLEPHAAVAGYEIHQPYAPPYFDPILNTDVEAYEHEVTFLYEITLADDALTGPTELSATTYYQVCDATQCLRPVKKTLHAIVEVDPTAEAAAISLPPEYLPGYEPPANTATSAPAAAPSDQGLLAFMALAFGLGLAAIFTPCVFPMIPITMSFFLGRQPKGQTAAVTRDGVMQAAVFCLGIVALFTGLGLLATALLGPFGVVELGSNPWVNGFIACVFVVFGLSLLGAFEITLPSGVLTKLNQASSRGGYGGTLVMGLTFSLTAFACVGPFVGTLLAASIGEGGVRPLAGMASFASGLAAPFFLLALFPGWLQRMPQAGGWMSRVKVVLGFVVLAASLKYLSNIDQVMRWGFLSRDRFLAVWVVLFAMTGLYLLGLLRMEGIDPDQKVGVPRLLVGAAFLVLGVSLLPGMFGAHLGEIEAYIPPPAEGYGLGGGSSEATQLSWIKDDYDEAIAQAGAEGKHVLVAFSGYACTNCHWMKANMFTRPAVAEAMSNMVRVELYLDGRDETSERNQEFQESRFDVVSMPYYVILDSNENVIATSAYQPDEAQFLAFLRGS